MTGTAILSVGSGLLAVAFWVGIVRLRWAHTREPTTAHCRSIEQALFVAFGVEMVFFSGTAVIAMLNPELMTQVVAESGQPRSTLLYLYGVMVKVGAFWLHRFWWWQGKFSTRPPEHQPGGGDHHGAASAAGM